MSHRLRYGLDNTMKRDKRRRGDPEGMYLERF